MVEHTIRGFIFSLANFGQKRLRLKIRIKSNIEDKKICEISANFEIKFRSNIKYLIRTQNIF